MRFWQIYVTFKNVSDSTNIYVIQLEDILRIYNAYGLTGKGTVRFSINTGPMNCQLNTGRENSLYNPIVSNVTRFQHPAMTDSIK